MLIWIYKAKAEPLSEQACSSQSVLLFSLPESFYLFIFQKRYLHSSLR